MRARSTTDLLGGLVYLVLGVSDVTKTSNAKGGNAKQ